jgi:hypothetical protein
MIRSLKAALGLSLLAALVFSAMSVIGASAKNPEKENHFSSSTTNTKYTVTENTGGSHVVTLSAFGGTVTCHNPQYLVHHTSVTKTTSLTVTPVNTATWNCTSGSEQAHVNFNGCHYQFTAKASKASHATVHFFCPAGKKAEVNATGNLCLETFGEQTPSTNGVTYTNTNGEVTVNITAEGITAEAHSGFCTIFGTHTNSAKMTGSVTVAGFETTTNVKSHITAT